MSELWTTILDWRPSLGPSEWVAALSAFVALASAAISVRVLNRQLRIQLEQVRAAVDADKHLWFREVLRAFADLKALAAGGPAAFPEPDWTRRRIQARETLSALADEGRLYFPNFIDTAHGRHKQPAFRGWRQPALDAILVAHDLAAHLCDAPDVDATRAKQLLFDARRVFVSEVQSAIDPRRREALWTSARKRRRAYLRKSDLADFDSVAALLEGLHRLGATMPSFRGHEQSPEQQDQGGRDETPRRAP